MYWCLTPVDDIIMMLSLRETDLAVLSACESGIGSNGMEYATLARAFAHAGVPSTIASLWRVPGEPTRELMQRLYTHLTNDEDAITALGLSQAGNVSVRQSRPSLTPTAWAGFVVLGKP
jgi:CHAT domain-containing protein